jgi:PAS domain S-box-containing protein
MAYLRVWNDQPSRSGGPLEESKPGFSVLLASVATLRGVVESAPDGIIVVDGTGAIVLVNRQAQRMFGYEEQELLGQLIEMLLPDRLRTRHVEYCQGYFQSPTTRPMGIGLSLAGRRRDGSEFPVEISLSPMPTSDGLLVTGVIRDVTDRRQVEEQIRTLNENLARRIAELDAVNKELEAFSYSVSHDLRAPLRSIDGFGQALLEEYAEHLDDTAADYLRRIRAATQRMGELIDDLLDLSRVTRREMRHEDVDLSALATTVIGDLTKAQPPRDIEVQIAAGLVGRGDAHLLRVLLENLLGNAWKFTGRQTAARVEFGARREGDRLVYYVRDNGVGFDMTYAHKLFGAFQRLHAATEFPGTGIGLATVERIVHRHGGRVWAHSEIGQGATFFFTLG